MRFDEFVGDHAISVIPVDRHIGCEVRVELPLGWEPFDEAPGVAVWVCRSDPFAKEFCANAVLTMHRVEAALDCAQVFTMLAEQQLQSISGCRERSRDIAAAEEGTGVAGTLEMEIAHHFGQLFSVCRSRIVAVGQGTLVIQLTMTVLRDSPVIREPLRLAVRTGDENREAGWRWTTR